MFTPVDFISVSRKANPSTSTETAGSIASKPAPVFSTSTETAGSIACAAPSSAPSTCSFSAVA